jgi:hypothetical protein
LDLWWSPRFLFLKNGRKRGQTPVIYAHEFQLRV